MADYQSKGIGRGPGRQWSSAAYKNICATFIVYPESMQDALKINLGFSVAVAKTAREFGAANAGVKWPNDIWVDGKKLCGLLPNSDTIQDTKLVMMMGCGVNINEEVSLHSDVKLAACAISMKEITQREISREV